MLKRVGYSATVNLRAHTKLNHLGLTLSLPSQPLRCATELPPCKDQLHTLNRYHSSNEAQTFNPMALASA